MQASGGSMDELRGFDHMILSAAEVLKATGRAKELAASGESPDQPGAPDAGESAPEPEAFPAEPK
jgi:hypothetical protein